jgi:hypothetical protein
LSPKQRENLAKYCYDLSKIIFAILVIGPLTRPGEMGSWVLISGFIAAFILLLLGLSLDKGK